MAKAQQSNAKRNMGAGTMPRRPSDNNIKLRIICRDNRKSRNRRSHRSRDFEYHDFCQCQMPWFCV